jgi:hypothetical protein
MACGAHSPVAVAHQRAHHTVSPVRMHKTKEPKSPDTSGASFLSFREFSPSPFTYLHEPVRHQMETVKFRGAPLSKTTPCVMLGA